MSVSATTPYQRMRLVRRRSAFDLFSAETGGGEPRIVVTAAPDADAEAAARCLERLAAAHAAVDHPFFAQPAEVADDHRWVAFHGHALADGEHLFQRLGETQTRLPFAEATAFVRTLCGALIDLHARTGAPLLERVGWGNFVFCAEGTPRYVGLGHNIVALNEHGAPSGAPGVFVAPEVGAGQQATPGADAHACVAMFRSMFPYVELPPLLQHAFQGRGVAPLRKLVAWGNEAIFASAPELRPTVRMGLSVFERTWRFMTIEPEEASFRRSVRALFQPFSEASLVLEVAPDGSGFTLNGGERHDLRRRKAQRLILAGLVEAHRAGPQPVTIDALLELGWPGERPLHEAGHNRVHVALSSLRKLPLHSVLQRHDDGYRIDPAVVVREEC